MANNRRYPERPVLGVGALIFDSDKILLVERAREPLKGYGRCLAESSKPASAGTGLVREVREETGLEMKAGHGAGSLRTHHAR